MKKVLFIALFLISFSSQSQILNIERNRLEKDTSKVFMFKTVAGLSIFNRSAAENTPVNLFGYNVDVNALYYPGKHGYMFISKFDYLRINDSDFLNFGFVHGRVNWMRENRLNYETFVQYSFDNFRGLDPRWIAGGAVRYYVVKSEQLTLIVGTGGFYERERWIHPFTDEFVEARLVKTSNYISIRQEVNKYVDFNMVNYYQTGYDRSINSFRNRISNSTILNTKLTERFSITNTFEIAYEDKPIVPITKVVYSFRTGLSINF